MPHVKLILFWAKVKAKKLSSRIKYVYIMVNLPFCFRYVTRLHTDHSKRSLPIVTHFYFMALKQFKLDYSNSS